MINCAGRTKRVPTLDLTDEPTGTRSSRRTCTGTLRAAQVFGRHMVERGYGRIVNIASLSSFVALFEVAGYAREQGGGGGADEVARHRVGAARRDASTRSRPACSGRR